MTGRVDEREPPFEESEQREVRSEQANRRITCCTIAVVVAMSVTTAALAVKVDDAELARAHEWAKARFADKPSADLPFSFTALITYKKKS
jgi:hypothetical protein